MPILASFAKWTRVMGVVVGAGGEAVSPRVSVEQLEVGCHRKRTHGLSQVQHVQLEPRMICDGAHAGSGDV